MNESANKVNITKGTVVEVDFPFSQDPAKSKRRPALILWTDKYQRDFILAFITTKWLERKETGDVHIKKSDSGFSRTGLVTDSKIKVTKLVSLSRNKLLAKYGLLTNEMLERVNKEIKNVFSV